MLRILEIAHRSRAYEQAVRLREAVLRRPLGLVFTAQELDDEAGSHHIVALEDDDDDDGACVGCLVLCPSTPAWCGCGRWRFDLTGSGRGSAARWSASPSSPRGRAATEKSSPTFASR